MTEDELTMSNTENEYHNRVVRPQNIGLENRLFYCALDNQGQSLLFTSQDSAEHYIETKKLNDKRLFSKPLSTINFDVILNPCCNCSHAGVDISQVFYHPEYLESELILDLSRQQLMMDEAKKFFQQIDVLALSDLSSLIIDHFDRGSAEARFYRAFCFKLQKDQENYQIEEANLAILNETLFNKIRELEI